jgi:tRNA-specific 2-thiouridylase
MLNHKTIIVGLSGGVDSSVSAALLKAQGADVHGLFMKNWEEDDTATYCSAEADLNDVKSICKTLRIPLHTINFAQEYWERVFSLFLEEYQAGRTPNPDILCNKEIKFKAFLDHAAKLGADYIATGHYAQCERDTSSSLFSLHRGNDTNKDQSYFLYTLSQHALAKTVFPIGHLPKSEVRDLAKQYHLITHNKKDSTGICFIGERKFKLFSQEFLLNQPGQIQTLSGDTLGQHDGLMYYTLGQRHGLHIGGQKGYDEKPWYVVAKKLDDNLLIVTQDQTHPWHFSTVLLATDVHWIAGAPPSLSFSATAKARYRQPDQTCEVQCLSPRDNPSCFIMTKSV